MSSKSGFFKLKFTKIDPKFPITPVVEIHSRHNGTYSRMTQTITEPDLDFFIDALIRELQNIRQEGHKKFAKAKKELKG